MEEIRNSLLKSIHSPADLKSLSPEDLPALCDEIRKELIDTVTKTGGHLASNLGVVELTVALHRVLNAPADSIIWDVGHQSYVHKLLTGRQDTFDTIRSPGGLSGFTKRTESEYDPFGAGHSSTSLSAAIGIATAKKLSGDNSYTAAILGDGAFTGGLIHEALNNLDKSLKLILILNENEMSISRNIGGYAHHLQKLRASAGYHKTKRVTRNILYRTPLIGKPLFRLVRRVKKLVKNALYHSNYFEDMGIYYMGPADGHDLPALERLFTEALTENQPVVIHVKTIKGKGYAPAEAEPNYYHGIAPAGTPEVVNFSTQMGDYLVKAAEKDDKLIAITAAMGDGCGLIPFSKAYPKRYFDVGIAEEHALVFAAGLAAQGYHPVFAVYSTFLQRGYDNILHDIALQNLPVVMMIDRASLSSGDGPTHHGIYDPAFLSHIPGISLYAPFDFVSLQDCMDKALTFSGPAAIRYPNAGENRDLRAFCQYASDGLFSSSLTPGSADILLITYGKISGEALKAVGLLYKEGISADLVILEQLLPITHPASVLSDLIAGDAPILFIEEGAKNGGIGMVLKESIGQGRIFEISAIDNEFGFSKSGESLYKTLGLSAEDIASKAAKMTGGRKNVEA